MVVSFVAPGIAFMISLLFITSNFAKCLGRNPSTWFVIGVLLSVIATFILFSARSLNLMSYISHLISPL